MSDLPERQAGAERTGGGEGREGLLIAAAALLLFAAGIGLRGFWFPDEPDVAQPTIEMLRRGDWITPTHNGRPWIDYPPLVYWLGHLFSLASGGLSTAALRLPSVLAGVCLVVGTWAAGRRWFGPAVGRLAALLLATFPFFAWQAMNVHPDMCFAAGQGLGVLAYIRGDEERGRRRLVWWIAAFALFGLAWLSKGPLGLLLPGLVLTIWQLSRGRWRSWLAMAPLALVAAAVALPWYFALIAEHGREWVLGEIYAQNFARYGAGARGHGQPPWYYLRVIWGGIAPLGFALPWAMGIGIGFRRCWRNPRWRALWIWLVTCVVFLSLAVTKREVYLLPVYPAVALLLAQCYEKWRLRTTAGGRCRPESVVAGLTGALFVLLGVVCAVLALAPGILAARLEGEQATIASSLRPGLALFALAAFAGAWGAIRRLLRRRGAQTWREWVAASLAGALLVTQLALLPVIDRARSYRPAVEWAEARLPPDAPLALYGEGWTRDKRCGFLNHMRPGRVLLELHSQEEFDAFRREHPGWPVLTGPREYEGLAGRTGGLSEEAGAQWHFGSKTFYGLPGAANADARR